MAKKTFVLKTRLVKGERWHIDYQRLNPETGAITRHRQDFSLNDIDDLVIREQVGNILCRHLEHFTREDLPAALRQEAKTEKGQRVGETVKEAVKYALQIKMGSQVKKTASTYESTVKQFFEWSSKNGYADFPVREFTRKHAQAYLSYLQNRRRYQNTTVNNYIIRMRAIWTELLDADMVDKNVFAKVKMLKASEKNRRAFTDQERQIVAAAVMEKDYYLFRALLLQFYCYVRPVEIARMRFKAFDFSTGTVAVEVKKGKTPRTRYATIPRSILHYFTDGVFNLQPTNYFIFGAIDRAKCGPAPTQAHENRQYKRHKKILMDLVKVGALETISGLTWYSWKDTGISAHAKQTTPLSTRDQAGHSDFQMTLIYYQGNQVNEEYRQLKDDLFLIDQK